MIEPNQEDVGREVYYKRPDMQPSQYEKGVITGYSPTGHYVRVRFSTNPHSESTRKEDLYWDATPLEGHKPEIPPEKPNVPKVTYCCDAMERALNNDEEDVYPIDFGTSDPKLLPAPVLTFFNGELTSMKFCLFCGAQLWQECPSCHGYGEVMYRAPDPDGGSTPEPRGCSRCTISPGLIPLAKPIPRLSKKELEVVGKAILVLVNAIKSFNEEGFEARWKSFLNWRKEDTATLKTAQERIQQIQEATKDEQ